MLDTGYKSSEGVGRHRNKNCTVVLGNRQSSFHLNSTSEINITTFSVACIEIFIRLMGHAINNDHSVSLCKISYNNKYWREIQYKINSNIKLFTANSRSCSHSALLGERTSEKYISHNVHKNAKVSQVKSDLILREKHQALTNLQFRKYFVKKNCTNFVGPIVNK